MSQRDALMQEQMRFLSQDTDRLATLRGRDLYDTLEGLDLTHGQYFRALDTNLDDYCAKEFGVDLRRISVERFFHTDPNAKWLFPEVVREAVLTGLRSKPRYPELIVRDERITSPVYDMPYVQEDANEEELRSVAEGAAIPESVIRYGDRVVRLDKKGRGVIASYEVIRRMSVDMLRVHMRRMGERLGRTLDARLSQVLLEGDGSGETAPETLNSNTAGNWKYEDLLLGHLTLLLQNHFTPTHILAGPQATGAILMLEHPESTPLFDFAKTGSLPTPLGMKLVPMESQPDTEITFLDASYAAQKLTEQELLLENDKLINQQWDRAYMTIVTDFAIVYEKARIVVTNNWS